MKNAQKKNTHAHRILRISGANTSNPRCGSFSPTCGMSFFDEFGREYMSTRQANSMIRIRSETNAVAARA